MDVRDPKGLGFLQLKLPASRAKLNARSRVPHAHTGWELLGGEEACSRTRDRSVMGLIIRLRGRGRGGEWGVAGCGSARTTQHSASEERTIPAGAAQWLECRNCCIWGRRARGLGQ